MYSILFETINEMRATIAIKINKTINRCTIEGKISIIGQREIASDAVIKIYTVRIPKMIGNNIDCPMNSNQTIIIESPVR